MNNLDVKNLRIYHKKHLSFKELKDKEVFSFIDNLSTKVEKDIFLESLILIVRSINVNDTLSDLEIDKRVENYIKLVEASRRQKIDDTLKNTFLFKLKTVYRGKNYKDHFRGDIVEYLMIYLQKSSSSKVLHEPQFKHKRRRLISKSYSGFDCLVDVVKISKTFNKIELFECKANLDNCITYIKSKKNHFKRKLNYMNALESELTKYYCCQGGEKVQVTKNLVSLITPKKTISPKYKRFNQIDLLRSFKLGQSIV